MRLLSVSSRVLCSALLLCLSIGTIVGASPYGEDDYSQCTYSDTTSCLPAPSSGGSAGGGGSVATPTAPTTPSRGQGSSYVSADIDSDGKLERATDKNNDPSDGYEFFEDSDGSSVVVSIADGDDDGKADYLIDIDGNGIADIYWDPDSGYILQLSQQAIRDIDEDSQTEYALDANDATDDGFELFLDPDSSTTVSYSFDGDNDGKTDYLLDTNGTGEPDVYWDPDGLLLSIVQAGNFDQDDTLEYAFQNGFTSYYYDPDTNTVYLLPEYPSVGDSEDKGRLSGLDYSKGFLGAVADFIRSLPKEVVSGFPYLLLLIMITLIARFGLQARREAAQANLLIKHAEFAQNLADQKHAFVQLYSHHIRTPITKIVGAVDLAVSLKEEGAKIASVVKAVQDSVNNLVERVESNTMLASITGSNVKQTTVRAYTSWRFIVPVALLILFGILAQLLFIDVGAIEPSLVQALVQLGLSVLVVQLFFAKLRKRQIARSVHMHEKSLADQRFAIDQARNMAIQDTVQVIGGKVKTMPPASELFAAQSKAGPIYSQGVMDIVKLTERFALVRALSTQPTGTIPMQAIPSMQDYLQKTFEGLSVPEGVRLSTDLEEHPITTNPAILGVALRAVVGNALEHASAGSQVEIKSALQGTSYVIAVSNAGEQIQDAQLQKLFQPFSRATSTEVYNESGVGLGLYLAKLAVDYLGGTISIDSNSSLTTVHITLNQ